MTSHNSGEGELVLCLWWNNKIWNKCLCSFDLLSNSLWLRLPYPRYIATQCKIGEIYRVSIYQPIVTRNPFNNLIYHLWGHLNDGQLTVSIGTRETGDINHSCLTLQLCHQNLQQQQSVYDVTIAICRSITTNSKSLMTTRPMQSRVKSNFRYLIFCCHWRFWWQFQSRTFLESPSNVQIHNFYLLWFVGRRGPVV